MLHDEEGPRRFSRIKRTYKRVEVSDQNTAFIREAVNNCPEDWGPPRLIAYIKRHHRGAIVTDNEVWTVLNP
jgi:hypothetical protein